MINVFLLDGGDSQVKAVARTLRLSKQKSIRLWIGRTYVNQPPYNNWKDNLFMIRAFSNMSMTYTRLEVLKFIVRLQQIGYGILILFTKTILKCSSQEVASI